MELGEKLRQQRLALGLSQRQLVGDKITRNMLSQIENGAAAPSMDTLRYLAQRLQKPVSYFLEETGTGDNLERIWQVYDSGDDAQVLSLLEDLQEHTRESSLLHLLSLLRYADLCARRGRDVYAQKLLMQAEVLESEVPWLPELKIRRLQILAKLHLPVESAALPNPDGQLFLYAYAYYEEYPARAAACLDACGDRSSFQWRLLRAKIHILQGEYAPAAELLKPEEKQHPDEVIPLMETCCREMGDFQQAYYYACLQRK